MLQERIKFFLYQIKCKIGNEWQDIQRNLEEKNNSEIINQQEIRIAGLRRTGNHAIISWLEEQQKLKGNTAHLNNLKVDRNPYRHKHQNLTYYHSEHKWAIENYKSQAAGNFIARNCLIYSYEDYPLERIFTPYFERKHDLYLGKTKQRYDLLIVRDPFNLLASRLKRDFYPVKSKRYTFVDLWIQYAKEYLGETNYLKHNKVCVNYNLWVESVEYRQQLAQKLNIEFSDAGINNVHSCGGGSSFDGKNMDGKASKMDITGRWKYYKEDPTYIELINNEELLKYSFKIFGHIPGTEVLLKSKSYT